MEIEVVQMNRCALMRLGGRIDGTVAPEFGQRLRALTDAGTFKIALNMAGVTFMSSAALRELLHAWQTCRKWQRGDLCLAEVPANVDRVLELTSLKVNIAIYATEAEAVGSF